MRQETVDNGGIRFKDNQAVWQAVLNRAGHKKGKTLSKLGSGVSGSAYGLSNGLVLKVTNNEREAHAAAALIAHKTKRLFQPYDVFFIPREGESRILWGITQERLFDISWSWANFINDFKSYSLPPHKQTRVDVVMVDAYEKQLKETGRWNASSEKKTRWLRRMVAEAASYGVFFRDCHGGNLMRRQDGRHVLIDLGGAIAPKYDIPSVYDNKRVSPLCDTPFF
jgi:hypothetical protein